MNNATTVLAWLGTYALHSTIVLAAVAVAARTMCNSSIALRETMWRAGMLAAILTATLHASGLVQPVFGGVSLQSPRPAADTASVTNEVGREVAATRAPDEAGASDMVAPSEPTASSILGAPSVAVASSTPSAPVASTTPAVAAEASASPRANVSSVTARDRGYARLADLGFIETHWRSLTVAAWLLVALLALGRMGVDAVATRRALAARVPADSALQQRLALLARAAGTRVPRITLVAGIASPLTLPSGEICIPAGVPSRLPPGQLDALLAHELAHAHRRDGIWLLVAKIVQAVFFFQPFNWLASRRLAELAELAADDCAAHWTGDGRALAECLADFGREVQHGRRIELAAAMARRESQLLLRVRRLLERRRGEHPAIGGVPNGAKLAIGAALALLVAAAPGINAQDQAAPSSNPEVPESTSSRNIPELPDMPANADGSQATSRSALSRIPIIGRLFPSKQSGVVINGQHIVVNGSGYSINQSGSGVIIVDSGTSVQFISLGSSLGLTLRMEGDIGLEPDGSGIAEISNGGFFDVERRSDGVSRRVRYEGSPDGPRRGFWQDGERREWNAAADEFVRDVMPLVFRSTTVSAAERIDWLLTTGGDEALIDEIALIDMDLVQAHYIQQYAGRGPIAAEQLERLLELARDGIAADFELRTVLAALYKSQRLDDDRLAALLRAADSIASDTELASLLHLVADGAAENDAAARAYLDAARSIASDSEQSAALEPLLASNRLGASSFESALELAANGIASDSVLAALLRDVAGRAATSDAFARSYLSAARSISSDSYQHGALLALAEQRELDADVFPALLDAARSISSDSYCASLLTQLAPRMPRDERTLQAYDRALATISSENYRRQALDALN